MLTDHEMLLAGEERLQTQCVDLDAVAAKESQLGDLENRRGRLLKLFEMGEIDDEYFLRESNSLRVEKAKVEELHDLKVPAASLPRLNGHEQACQRVQDWVMSAESEDFSLLLDALQIQVHVENGRGELERYDPRVRTKEWSCPCLCYGRMADFLKRFYPGNHHRHTSCCLDPLRAKWILG